MDLDLKSDHHKPTILILMNLLGYKNVQLTVFACHTFIHEMSKNINRAEAVMPEKEKKKKLKLLQKDVQVFHSC